MAAAAILLIAYPGWDALANLIDAVRSGGLARGGTRALNLVVSTATALANALVVAPALPDMNRVLVRPAATGIMLRRLRGHGAQWAMVPSGAQSALAGAFFIAQSHRSAMPSIANVAGHAGFGAFHFLVAACWLQAGAWRRVRA